MKIWILNHYATDMYFDGTGRHQSFAKYLIKDGHKVKIFCASTVHNSTINIDTKGKKYIELIGKDNVPYIIVKTSNYVGNGIRRINNMIEFYFKIFGVMKEEMKKEGEPDVVIASSVHPLTLVAGIQFSKKVKCPCICEVRDLWPLSIVEYNNVSNGNPIIQLLYKMEHWIYKKADAIVFSFSGGKQYILDKCWQNDVELEKIFYVNTGIDLDLYKENARKNVCNDADLNSDSLFKIVYTGSIRKVNDLQKVIDAAQILMQKNDNVRFIFYGDGDERERLVEYCKEKAINNVIFKGKVPKHDIPGILEKSNLLIINVKENKLARYGVSWNKLFEYMASGKPIIANSPTDIITDNNLGVATYFDNAEQYAEAIEPFINMEPQEYNDICQKCLSTVDSYNCKNLSKEILQISKKIIAERKENL